MPTWADFELHNRRDIAEALGDRSWIISSHDSSIREYGFLVSKKRFIWTDDDNCFPVVGANGQKVNAIAKHLRNLLTNSTPYFFNTLYDPYTPGSDFVRGYPYSLRAGVKTVLSHGLWLNTPDYDAPTQLMKPLERVTQMHQMVVTVPSGVLYPMCGMNMAFDRELIGPAFMQGLMGDGQPWGRYDDMFAGWASKVIADHLGYGVKSGDPYIYHKKASNPFINLMKEYMGLWWQETLIEFFYKVVLPPSANTAQACYVILADLMNKELSTLHPYFARLAEAMKLWVRTWDEVDQGIIRFRPSQGKAPTCITYTQRYRQCTKMKTKGLEEQMQAFHSSNVNAGVAKEAILLRMKAEDGWDEDLWLSTCAWILESSISQQRHVYLEVSKGSETLVPLEFRSLVVARDDDVLSRLYTPEIYKSGWHHGDLVAAWLAHNKPHYDFWWVVEGDVRYGDNLDTFLTESRKTAKLHKGSLVGLPADDPYGDADVIMYGPMLFSGTEVWDTWVWNSPKHYTGRWAGGFPKKGAGGLAVTLGLSKKMLDALYENAVSGTTNANLELNVPLTAIDQNLKLVRLTDYADENNFVYRANKDTTKYATWRTMGACFAPQLYHPVK